MQQVFLIISYILNITSFAYHSVTISLLYPLQNFLTDGKTEARLGDFGIKANVSLWLIKILYALPAALTQATFDLYWGYPGEERDYLDASCIAMYKDGTFIVVDYSARNFDDAIFHSGDVMDDENKIGHHTIQVCLNKYCL